MPTESIEDPTKFYLSIHTSSSCPETRLERSGLKYAVSSVGLVRPTVASSGATESFSGAVTQSSSEALELIRV